MTDWQPIETAPKDGTHVLLYDPKQGWEAKHEDLVFSGRFIVSHDHKDGCWFDTRGEHYESEVFGRGICNPTHWMPLPCPPTTKG